MRYKIQGDNMPIVVCALEDGESIVCEAGAMSWMSPNMQMETKSKGGIGGFFGRALSGESGFQNIYTARGGSGLIAFASSYVGNILAVEITPEKPVIIQKRAFLACTPDVDMEVFFQKKIGTALFGGEGFIMQKLSGSGIVFLELDGSVVNYNLKAGEQMLISTGHLAMMDATVTMDIQQIKGAKNILFGGESLFNTVVVGPGVITLQSMPLSNLVGLIASRLPATSTNK
jgi:uncharacterized protein (TIGR00266 family)